MDCFKFIEEYSDCLYKSWKKKKTEEIKKGSKVIEFDFHCQHTAD